MDNQCFKSRNRLPRTLSPMHVIYSRHSSHKPSLLPLIYILAPAASGEQRRRTLSFSASSARAVGSPRHQVRCTGVLLIGRHVCREYCTVGVSGQEGTLHPGRTWLSSSRARCTVNPPVECGVWRWSMEKVSDHVTRWLRNVILHSCQCTKHWQYGR